MAISVEKLNETTFRVRVEDGTATSHTVTVSADYHQKLTAGRISPEQLVERSFEFLLEREPKESILRSFELPVIGRYFPEYGSEIRRRLRG